jgi:hypothetical protein
MTHLIYLLAFKAKKLEPKLFLSVGKFYWEHKYTGSIFLQMNRQNDA